MIKMLRIQLAPHLSVMDSGAKWLLIYKILHLLNTIQNPHKEKEKDSHLQTQKEFLSSMHNQNSSQKIQPQQNTKRPSLGKVILFHLGQNMKILLKGIKMYFINNSETWAWRV